MIKSKDFLITIRFYFEPSWHFNKTSQHTFLSSYNNNTCDLLFDALGGWDELKRKKSMFL